MKIFFYTIKQTEHCGAKMDEYLGEITLTHFGRPLLKSKITIPYAEINCAISFLYTRFLRACNSAEFREHYFRAGRVEMLNYCTYKHIVINCEPAVFFHVIREFNELNGALVKIGAYSYDGNFSLAYNLGGRRWSVVDIYIEEYMPENFDMLDALRKLGFTIFNKCDGRIAELIVKH